MSTAKVSPIKYFCFLLTPFFFTSLFAQDDFLNTPDTEIYSVLHSEGKEKGYYVQVSILVPEDVLSKTDNLALSTVAERIMDVKPILKFSQNSAQCEVLDGPFSQSNDLVTEGTQVTYSYFIHAKSKKKDHFCKLRIYSSDTETLLREIDYFTTNGEIQ